MRNFFTILIVINKKAKCMNIVMETDIYQLKFVFHFLHAILGYVYRVMCGSQNNLVVNNLFVGI